MPETLRNILIIKPSSLGDIILALPALSGLRRSFPESKISWLVRSEFIPLLENHPHLTEIIPFDREFLGKAWYHPRAFACLVSLISRLRRSKFDAVFDFQGLFRTASLGWLSGCKKRFGMANARELGYIFYTHKVTQNQQCVHLVDYYLKIIQAAGVSDIGVRFILPEDQTAVDSVGRLLTECGIMPNNYAVFVTGSAHPDKCWPIERFAALAEKISSAYHLPIVATGDAFEAGTIENFKSIASVPMVNLAGRTSLGELTVLMKSATLVVSNDTGPGHIAAALGRPLVLIFGYSNPARVAPYGRSNCVVAVEPRRQGLELKSFDPRYNIKNIAVDEVFQKVCEQIEQKSQTGLQNA